MLHKIYLDKRVTVNGRESVLSLQNFINLNAHIVNVISASLGSLYSFSNGLTLTGNAVTWGGTLTGNTGVNAATFDVTFTNANLFSLDNTGSNFTFDLLNISLDSVDISITASDEVTISATNSFNLLTPNVVATTATSGALLQLINELTGDSEYTPYTFPLTSGVEGDILQLDNAGALQWVAGDSIVVENTLFVMENGDDLTGLRTRFDKPFATIQAAMIAASTQDTVIVYPGTYAATTGDVVLKLGVKLKMEPGSTLNILTADNATFEFGSGNGIYGDGVITIYNETPDGITLSGANSDLITFECDTLISTNFFFTFENFSKIDMNIRYVQVNECTFLSFAGLEHPNITVNIDKYLSFGSSAHIEIYDLVDGTVDININEARIGDLCLGKGFLYTESGTEVSQIKLNVNRLLNDNSSDLAILGDQALVTGALCLANKYIVFNYLEVYGKLYSPIGTSNPAGIERGYMKFVGKIKTNSSSLSAVSTWIDFGKQNQFITFDLDIIDETTPVFGVPADPYEYFALLNVNSHDTNPGQYVTGRIETPRTVGRGVIVYGTGSTGIGALTGNTATLRDMTIVTSGMNSFHLNQPGFGVLPTRNCITNLTPDISVVFAIETPIDDVNVR